MRNRGVVMIMMSKILVNLGECTIPAILLVMSGFQMGAYDSLGFGDWRVFVGCVGMVVRDLYNI